MLYGIARGNTVRFLGLAAGSEGFRDQIKRLFRMYGDIPRW